MKLKLLKCPYSYWISEISLNKLLHSFTGEFVSIPDSKEERTVTIFEMILSKPR